MLRLGAAQQLKIGDAALLGIGADRAQLVELRFLGRHHQLAGARMGDAALAAIGVEPLAPFDAKPRLQAARLVVKAGMDDFRIARAGLGADGVGLLDHQHLASGERQRPGDSETDDTSPGDYAIDCLHARSFQTECAGPNP